MKKENFERVYRIMEKLHRLEKDIEDLERLKNGNSPLFVELNTSISLLDDERHYDKIQTLINFSLSDKRQEYQELEEELKTL